ncbi:phage transcriptional regulator [Candidatus Sodalis pierantonius str. SOPE]|uniref:Phage transcriptional regulator n=2 Tax=Sodalis TaxID=84565 RepID=W0HPK9_9GAMM|nr:Rha family transcriptional regulator [Candidatus Sodalis pierantonius]AHF74048.1 phage transcriptional regulator [Candidatus Sodalis pierantonius str. SOPE]
MQNLTIAQTLTMSSREIAELTEKQHKHVLEDCRKMFEALNIQSADFSADYKDSKGRVYQEFLLDQDLTMTLVMGYSIELRHKVAKRWRELEEQAKKPAIPQTYPDALRLAAKLAEEKQHLALVNKKQEKEIHCLQNLFQTGMTPVKFCKQLNGVNINRVSLFLAERNFLYDAQKDTNKSYIWRVKAHARDKYFTESPYTIKSYKGDMQLYEVILLQDGAKWLYRHYLKGELPMKKDWNGEFTHDKYLQAA